METHPGGNVAAEFGPHRARELQNGIFRNLSQSRGQRCRARQSVHLYEDFRPFALFNGTTLPNQAENPFNRALRDLYSIERNNVTRQGRIFSRVSARGRSRWTLECRGSGSWKLNIRLRISICGSSRLALEGRASGS